MSITLRVMVCISGLILIAIARRANIARKLTEKQSLFWIIGGGIIILFGLIPRLVFIVSDFFQVEYPPSIIFAISIILLFYGIFNCYQTNAELTARVQELAMQISILNDDNTRLKEMLSKDKQDNNIANEENLEK
ncbi:MAG: DUF2304 domain-containing protein [Bacillota bacterium]|jgi:hypothetical protein|nr:DUF2304 domain-containing protein [Bacillota bacterium]